MKKSEFKEGMRALARSGESLAEDLDGFAILAERAGARWDPEEPALPGGEWASSGSCGIVTSEGEVLIEGISRGGDDSAFLNARQRAALARLVAIREAAREHRKAFGGHDANVSRHTRVALFALLGEP